MTIKVGIPRALLFYEYAPLWISFFNDIGAEVIVSDKSNKNILNNGTIYTVDDACIPVKVFNGHVLNLKDKVDYIFVPRIMGIYEKEYICPKFCGLPEVVKYSLKDIPKLIDTKIDLTKSNNMKEAILDMGSYITKDKKNIISAYEKALKKYNEHKESLKNVIINHQNKNIMVMGHPYILYDEYLNMNVMKKLKNYGYSCITPDNLDDELINEYANGYIGKIFWLFFRKMLGSCLYLIDNNFVDGVIYISSFGCGIDSVVVETIERRLRRDSDIPFMLMTLDEHSGEAGFNTRLEAFIDMLKWRNINANNISTHGNHLYSRENNLRRVRY